MPGQFAAIHSVAYLILAKVHLTGVLIIHFLCQKRSNPLRISIKMPDFSNLFEKILIN